MGPTRGASDERVWRPRAKTAFGIRVVALLVPIVAAMIAIRLGAPLLFRPAGFGGLVLWVLQAGVLGAVVSRLVDTVSRRLLPLAVLFNLSLAFPDRAPSRFGVALRSGTIRRLRERADELPTNGLEGDGSAAARRAIEWVLALGRHDRLTRGHTERVRAYADLIGAEMGLGPDDRNRLSWGVILHDIGKMTVPPEILNKPDRPTAEEWAILSGHPAAGERMLEPLADWLGEWRHAAGQHHERWDGMGYPKGLAGQEISLAGRIAAVADAFDVVTSKRSYKQAMSNEAARREMVRCAGTQFDPVVVRAFMNVSLGRRRPVGSAAWVSDSTLWGTTASSTAGATAASVTVALGASVIVAAGGDPMVRAHPDFAVVSAAEDGVEEVDRDPAPSPISTDPQPMIMGDAGPDLVGEPFDAPVATDDDVPSAGTTTATTVVSTPDEDQPAGATSVPATVIPTPTTVDLVDDVVNPVVNPVVDPVVDRVVNPVVNPVVNAVVDPVGDRVVNPVVNAVVDPVVDRVVDPVVDRVVDPVVDRVVNPVVDLVVNPVRGPVVDLVVNPVVDRVGGPVVDLVVDPGADSVVDLVVDPLSGGARGVLGGSSRSGHVSLLP